jgi:hypothetical protein
LFYSYFFKFALAGQRTMDLYGCTFSFSYFTSEPEQTPFLVKAMKTILNSFIIILYHLFSFVNAIYHQRTLSQLLCQTFKNLFTLIFFKFALAGQQTMDLYGCTFSCSHCTFEPERSHFLVRVMKTILNSFNIV